MCYQANACSNLVNDEDALVQVVRSVLSWLACMPCRRILSSTAYKVSPLSLNTCQLFYHHRHPCRGKQTLLLSSPHRGDSDSTINQWRKQNPGVGLSHISDAYTRETLHACPLELKRQEGDYNEAICQLTV